MINAEKEPFCKASPPVFDQVTFIINTFLLHENQSLIVYIFQKMVLIGLLYKSFIENLSNFPSSVIHVSKQDVLNIEFIQFQYDFSAVELSNSTIDLSQLLKLSKLLYNLL